MSIFTIYKRDTKVMFFPYLAGVYSTEEGHKGDDFFLSKVMIYVFFLYLAGVYSTEEGHEGDVRHEVHEQSHVHQERRHP